MKTTISIIVKSFLSVVLLLTSMAVFALPVNVNKADAELIADSLAGIGVKTAEKIVKYREENGPFDKVEDLLNVSGIGEKKLAKIRSDIKLSGVKADKKIAKPTKKSS